MTNNKTKGNNRFIFVFKMVKNCCGLPSKQFP
jgi:hypothetical protein